MDLLEAIRHRARRDRLAFVDGGCPLHGDAFVDAVARLLDVVVVPVAHGDVLVQGARAKLELDAGMRLVYVDASLEPEQRTFCAAHELAHLLLHGGDDACGAREGDGAVDGPDSQREDAVEVYNPRQQREREANAYALELLAPRDDLLEAYLRDPEATSASLAARFGISQQAALGQLAAGLGARAPSRRDDAGEAVSPGGAGVPPAFVHGAGGTPAPPGIAPEPAGDSEGFLASLDDGQRAAVTVDPGPVFVEAGPGSGKTRTLVARVVWLIRERGVAPDRILVLTFSNDATGELRVRLTVALGRQATAVTVATFHAFALDVLRRYGGMAGLPGDVEVVNSIDARLLVRAHLSELPLRHYARPGNPSWFVPDLLRAVSRAKDSLVGPDAYAQAARTALAAARDDAKKEQAERQVEVAEFYRAYQRFLASQGVADFGDLLKSAADLLQGDETVAAELRDRYRHVLVDEYQDVNAACHALVESLAGQGAGLWVVGDPRQAIYAFRGATPALIDRFRRRYAAAYVSLARNYRSTAPLVSLFEAISSDAGAGVRETVVSERDPARPGRDLVWAVASDERSELSGLAARIREFAQSGTPLSDQAVLCRTNSRARAVARALEEAGIEVVAASRAFDPPAVKDLLAVLSVLSDGDGMGLIRLGAVAEHRFGAEAARHAIARAAEAGISVPDLLARDGQLEDASPEDREGLRRLAATLLGLETLYPWEALARYLFDRTAIARRLAADPSADASSARLAVASLLGLAHGFDARRWGRFTGTAYANAQKAFLDHVRFLIEEGADEADAPRGDTGLSGIRVLTAHASKGLEFGAVHVPFLARGIWPPRHRPEQCPDPPGLLADSSASSPDDAELFYVAVTRARSRLSLSRADRYGGRAASASPFWELATPYMTRLVGEPDRWDVIEDDTAPTIPQPRQVDQIDVDARSLETYLACPRRYYYEHVLGLRRRSGELSGFAFRRCVTIVARRLGELRDAGRLPASSEEVEPLLREAWSEHRLVGHPYEHIYWQEAKAMLERCRRSLEECAPAPGVGLSAAVELPSARVSLEIDRADALPNGDVALVRYRSGKPAPDQANDPRIALYELAASELSRARGGRWRVEIEYLSTGERVEVRRPSPEHGHRTKRRSPAADVDEAARGIALGRFEPKVGELCRTGSFNLICPA